MSDKISQGYLDLLNLIVRPKAVVTVGIHADEGGGEHDGMRVIELAEIHEFGIGVPPRSFVRSWADGNEARLKKKIGEIAKKNFPDLDRAADQAALWLEGDCQKNIADKNIVPENAKSTIRRKGSDTPLVDTGVLKASIKGKRET